MKNISTREVTRSATLLKGVDTLVSFDFLIFVGGCDAAVF